MELFKNLTRRMQWTGRRWQEFGDTHISRHSEEQTCDFGNHQRVPVPRRTSHQSPPVTTSHCTSLCQFHLAPHRGTKELSKSRMSTIMRTSRACDFVQVYKFMFIFRFHLKSKQNIQKYSGWKLKISPETHFPWSLAGYLMCCFYSWRFAIDMLLDFFETFRH